MVRVKSEGDSIGLNKKPQHLKSSTETINVFIVYLYIITAFGMCIILPHEYLRTGLFYSTVILATVMFAALAENSKTKFFFNIFVSISFLILFFALGFRNYSAIDDASYIQIFNSISTYGWLNNFLTTTREPGYLMLNALVSLFTDNYLYMQLISSFIPLLLFYRTFKKYRSMISLPMAVFLLCTMIYFQMLAAGLVRLFIAVSIVFNALYYIPQRNARRYIFSIVIASMFHYSAFFMLVLTYFALNKVNFSKKAKRFVALGFVATPFVFVVISRYFIPLMGSRYSGYGTIDDLSFNISSFDTIPLLVLLLFYFKKINIEKTDYFKLFLSIFALSAIMSFYSSMVSLGRLIFYANSAFFLAAPMVGRAINQDPRKIIFWGTIILYGFFYVYHTQLILESHISNLFPYQNIFFRI